MNDKPDLFLFEYKMDESDIFVSGINGKPQHREAYMTIMDFPKMHKFLDEHKDDYTLSEWECLRKCMDEDFGYLSPMNKLTAHMIDSVILNPR